MNLLHINSYYIDNHLYSQIYSYLDEEYTQKVYIPIKTDREPENVIPFKNTELTFKKLITPNHKFNYFSKIKTLTKDLIADKLHENCNFIHAHNLFTDGAIAYKLHKKYGIKYIVAIRSTDIGLQYKYMYNRRSLAKKVLLNSEKIIFISETYRDKFFNMMSSSFIKSITDKTTIIPNGIDDIWLDSKVEKPLHTNTKEVYNLFYVGQIMNRKNIFNLIDAVSLLNKKQEQPKYKLTIVGGANALEPDYFTKFEEQIKQIDWLDYKGKIYDKNKLIELYKKSDVFVMPSVHELFGLVYIEAISQGVPVLYSKGEGIDGFLKNYKIGVGVDPQSTTSISEGILKIIEEKEHYNQYQEVAEQFRWRKIIEIYKRIYTNNE